MSRLKRFAGTSVGAMVAAILAAGGTSELLRDVLFRTNFAHIIYGNDIH